MNPLDERLQRLLAAAAKAAPEIESDSPPGVETRVLAQWRAARADDDSISVFAFFRRAVVGASLVLALCAAWGLTRTGRSITGDDAARLDYNIQMSLYP